MLKRNYFEELHIRVAAVGHPC